MFASSEILVTVLTYNRPRYLTEVLTSFFAVNSAAFRAPVLVYAQGSGRELRKTLRVLDSFRGRVETVLGGPNVGVGGGWSALMEEALRRYDPEFVLHIEDDWLSVEPLAPFVPEALAALRTPRVGTVRLRSVEEYVIQHNLVTREPVFWDLPTGDEHIAFGRAHWTFNPSLTRSSTVRALLPVRSERQAMKKFHALGELAGQLHADCFRHIGSERARGWRK